MAWQSSSILPTITTPAADIGKLTNDLAVLRGVLGGTPDGDVPFTPPAGSMPTASLAFDGGALSGLRNRIINPDFEFWQRGTANANTDGSGYLADRWRRQVVGYSLNQSRSPMGVSDAPGARFMWTAVSSGGSAAGDYSILTQRIEGARTLAGKTVTLTFWAQASNVLPIAVEFTQFFGTGGSPSAQVTGISVATRTLGTTWAKYTVTAALPAVTTKTFGTNGDDYLELNFWFGAGSTWNSRTNSLGHQAGTFYLARVQLEEGAVATPFEARPLALEERLCQRYACALPSFINGFGYAANTGYFVAALPATLRAASPLLLNNAGSVSVYTPAAGTVAATGLTQAGSSPQAIWLSVTVGSGLASGAPAILQYGSGNILAAAEL